MSSEYSKTTDAFRCDECGEEMAVPLFCDHCGTNYPERRAMGPFTVLGLAARFDHDPQTFESRELTLAARLHPDKWQSEGERTHKRAQLAWSAVNEALAKTQDPFARAETLLSDTEACEEKATVPQMFLIEQLELQEELETPVATERRKTLNRSIRKELKELERQLAGHFEIIDATALAGTAAGEGRLMALKAASTVVHMSRYWRNAQRALRGAAAQSRN